MSCAPVVSQRLCPVVVVQGQECSQVVLEVAVQGPPGVRGPIGPAGGAAFEREAGVPLSALTVVWEDVDGKVYPADYRNDTHVFSLLGIATNAAQAGGSVGVQRGGVLEDSFWSLTQQQRVYLGANGAVTQTPPEDGFLILVGMAVSPTGVVFQFTDPIDLED